MVGFFVVSTVFALRIRKIMLQSIELTAHHKQSQMVLVFVAVRV